MSVDSPISLLMHVECRACETVDCLAHTPHNVAPFWVTLTADVLSVTCAAASRRSGGPALGLIPTEAHRSLVVYVRPTIERNTWGVSESRRAAKRLRRALGDQSNRWSVGGMAGLSAYRYWSNLSGVTAVSDGLLPSLVAAFTFQ